MIKEPNWKTCTEEELWHYVGYYFAKNNIDMVLVGGSVVSVYSKGAYQSGDLDFVSQSHMDKKIPDILKKLGFNKEGRVFVHQNCEHLFIDVVSSPVAIGKDYNITPRQVKYEEKLLRILSPTDCIKDRLASYIYFEARECLDQAVLVAESQSYSKKEVKRWCSKEGFENIYDEFIRLTKKNAATSFFSKKKVPGQRCRSKKLRPVLPIG